MPIVSGPQPVNGGQVRPQQQYQQQVPQQAPQQPVQQTGPRPNPQPQQTKPASSGAKKTDDGAKFAEQWLTVKDIQNGCLILENNWKVTGVKITPRNIFILDQDSQASILIALRNLYNTLDYEFWILVADRPVDITLYLSQLQLLYNNTPNAKIRKLISEDMDKAQLFRENNVVDTEYFLMFQEKRDDLLQKKVRELISGFTSAGLTAMQTTNDDLRVLLDNFLNEGRATEFGTVLPE